MQSGLNLGLLTDIAQFDPLNTTQLIEQLGFKNTEAFDQALQQAAAVRAQKSRAEHYYIVQSTITENSLSHLFSPFIGAVLNLKTVYIASKQGIIEQVYPHYFQLDALELQKQQSIDEMYLGFDLLPENFKSVDIQCYGLCKALLDSECCQIYMLGSTELSQSIIERIQALTDIKIINIALCETDQNLNNINFKQLFWKTKTTASSSVCRNIAFANAPLLSQQLKVALDKAEHLIDDLLYSEHIFEKLSVFGEYTETILKHHRASTPRMIV